MRSQLKPIVNGPVANAWKPPPRLLVSEWANEYRHLSPEASAEPGQWRNARAPHTVLPMDILSPYHPSHRVVLKWSSQSAKTEVILNFIGYIIGLDPGPILAIQPNLSPMGEAFSKDRIAPMLRDTPALEDLIPPSHARSASSTVTHKVFPGGHLSIIGANSPAGLASRPIRYLLCDEIDRWETTKEGDPLLLARKRLQTFRNRRMSKELITSSPTYADLGVCVEFDQCEQQWQRQLRCPDCNKLQYPKIEHFSSRGYVCRHCGTLHSPDQERRIKAAGEWVLIKDEGNQSVGFHFNQWASPFSRWLDTLEEWAAAQADPARRQAVTNTVFAEPWDGEGERVEPNDLSLRAESYDVPREIEVITLGCDVQGDRLEYEIVGWGRNAESWSLAYEVLPGDPTGQEVYDDLLEVFSVPIERDDGEELRIAALCIDSGAYTKHVYDFVKRAKKRNIIPVKGIGGMERDVIAGDYRQQAKRAARRAALGKPAEMLGVDSIKKLLYRWFVAPRGGSGYCHFPKGRSEEYYQQLTGERLQVVSQRGKRPVRRWVPIHPAVEALDCRVYAYAAYAFVDHSPKTEKLEPKKKKKITRKESTWL